MAMLRIVFLVTVSAVTMLPAEGAGFDPRVITFGSERDQIKSTPIEQRPYRPLHVYGNSVRRRQARGGNASPRGDARR